MCRSKSQNIAQGVLALKEFEVARLLHIYLATPTEVQTDGMIREALRQGKRVSVPLFSYPFLSEITCVDDAFQKGACGFLEPILLKEVQKREVDLWIIPGVAYDKAGRRLGRGLGYYDRLLEGVITPMVGLAFDCQIVQQLPSDSTDRRMDQIVTETRTICLQQGKG